MTQHTVVIESCKPETPRTRRSSPKVADMLGKLPGLDERLGQAKRIFIKLNLGIKGCQTYKDRPIAYTDPAVYEGVATYLQGRTEADVLVGDGTDSMPPADAAREHGHMAVVDRMGHRFVDLHQPPFARFHVPEPAMFRWYDLSAELQDVDLFVSLAKMKSHHLCGVTLTMKNLFGLPPGPVYGSPRFTKSPLRDPAAQDPGRPERAVQARDMPRRRHHRRQLHGVGRRPGHVRCPDRGRQPRGHRCDRGAVHGR